MVTVSTVKLRLLKQSVCYARVEWDNYINKKRIAHNVTDVKNGDMQQ